MSRELSARILIALSICYGILIAILAVLDSGAVGTFAAIGAVVLGGLWAVRGVLSRNRST